MPKCKQAKPTTRSKHCWSDDATVRLQACLDVTDWSVFKSDNLDEYCDAVIGYILFCIDVCIPVKVIKQHSNQKPWMNSDVRRKLYERANAFRSGDAAKYKMARYALERSIREAKRAYGRRVEGHFTGNDPRQMWEGLGSITSYKPRRAISAGGDLTPDQLNTFYSRFDALRHLFLHPVLHPLTRARVCL